MRPARPKAFFIALALAALVSACSKQAETPADAGGPCVPDCEGKECGPDGCGGECGFCTSNCEGGRADYLCGDNGYCASDCCPDCAGKKCGDDGCSGNCGECAQGSTCNSQGMCAPIGCVDECCPSCDGKECGDDDGCGGKCRGTCPDAGQECKIGQRGLGAICVPCNTAGADTGAACETQADCACGKDCAKIFEDAQVCKSDPTKCQPRGQCLKDCLPDGQCGDPNQICACTSVDAAGNCLTGDCLPIGRLYGNFYARVLDSCSDQPGGTDIGSGTIISMLPGKETTVDMMFACRDTAEDGSHDLVVVTAISICAPQACPNWVVLVLDAASIKMGEVKVSDGSVIVEQDEVSFAGQLIAGLRVHGTAIDGKLELTNAGIGGKQLISANIDVTMVRYDFERCGGNSGVDCATLESSLPLRPFPWQVRR